MTSRCCSPEPTALTPGRIHRDAGHGLHGRVARRAAGAAANVRGALPAGGWLRRAGVRDDPGQPLGADPPGCRCRSPSAVRHGRTRGSPPGHTASWALDPRPPRVRTRRRRPRRGRPSADPTSMKVGGEARQVRSRAPGDIAAAHILRDGCRPGRRPTPGGDCSRDPTGPCRRTGGPTRSGCGGRASGTGAAARRASVSPRSRKRGAQRRRRRAPPALDPKSTRSGCARRRERRGTRAPRRTRAPQSVEGGGIGASGASR